MKAKDVSKYLNKNVYIDTPNKDGNITFLGGMIFSDIFPNKTDQYVLLSDVDGDGDVLLFEVDIGCEFYINHQHITPVEL